LRSSYRGAYYFFMNINTMRVSGPLAPRRALAAIILAIASVFCAYADGSSPAPSTPARPKIAVVLSGGSAFGIAHAGVLKKIEEAGIPIDMILGTSMGSIVGGLYASGYSPQAMQDLISNIDWNSLFMDQKELPENMFERSVSSKYALRIGFDSKGPNLGQGLLEGQNILAFFTARTIHMASIKNFDSYPVPYRAVAANILTGDKVVFTQGSIAEAMRSSMSIPVLFMPYDYQGQLLVDGGIVDNLPVDVAKQMGADIVIAVVSRGKAPDTIDELNSSVEIGSQTGNIFLMQNMKPNIEAADLVITPDLKNFSTASYAKAKEIIAQGEAAGDAAMPQLKALAAKIAQSRPLVAPDKQENRGAFGPPPRFSSVRVEGGSAQDRSWAAGIFAPLVGRDYTRDELENAIQSAYVSGNYALVKFGIEPTGDTQASSAGTSAGTAESALRAVVTLVPQAPAQNELFASIDFKSSISRSISSDMVVSSAFLAKELTGPGSALLATASIINKTSASMEYFQPLGPLFIMPWARFRFEYDMYASESIPIAVASKYRTYGAGIWGGLVLGDAADIMAGYSFENVLTGDDWTSLVAQNAGALRAAIRLDTRSISAFPRSGLAFSAVGRWFSPSFGGKFSFAQVEANASVAIPMGRADALNLSLFGGTDFTGIISGAQAAKVSYYSNLAQPEMFYGMGYIPTTCEGNSVVAGSLEYRHRVALINELMGGDIYIFANASAGAVVQYDDPTTYSMWPLKWSATIGVSARVSKHYGLLAGVSALGNIDDKIAVAPAFVIQLGTFSHPAVIDRR